jgi:hypothetical protein
MALRLPDKTPYRPLSQQANARTHPSNVRDSATLTWSLQVARGWLPPKRAIDGSGEAIATCEFSATMAMRHFLGLRYSSIATESIVIRLLRLLFPLFLLFQL